MPVRHHAKLPRALSGALVALLALVVAIVAGASRSAAAAPNPASCPPPARTGAAHHASSACAARTSGLPALPPVPTSGSVGDRIKAVNARLDALSKRGEMLDEQYNQAALALSAARRASTRAQQAALRDAAQYRAAHRRLVDAVTQQYEGGGTDPSIGALLSSSTPQAYLDSLNLADYLSRQFAATVGATAAARVRAARAAQQAETATAKALTEQRTVAKRRAALRQQTRQFRSLLDSLTAQQRRQRAHARAVAAARARAALLAQQRAAAQATASQPQSQRQTPHRAPQPTPGPVSSGVARVVAFAEAQVGKSYSYGASGPDSYDCSGLTMAAWAQVGVHLPHSAAEQYNYGTHVSYSQLQPGDLIFLYSPIGHVELYVGHDLAVSAADPSMGVVYVHPSQDMADYAGATRP